MKTNILFKFCSKHTGGNEDQLKKTFLCTSVIKKAFTVEIAFDVSTPYVPNYIVWLGSYAVIDDI